MFCLKFKNYSVVPTLRERSLKVVEGDLYYFIKEKVEEKFYLKTQDNYYLSYNDDNLILSSSKDTRLLLGYFIINDNHVLLTIIDDEVYSLYFSHKYNLFKFDYVKDVDDDNIIEDYNDHNFIQLIKTKCSLNNFEDGLPIDSVTFDQIDEDNKIVFNKRCYNKSTITTLINNARNNNTIARDPETRIPFTQDILDLIPIIITNLNLSSKNIINLSIYKSQFTSHILILKLSKLFPKSTISL